MGCGTDGTRGRKSWRNILITVLIRELSVQRRLLDVRVSRACVAVVMYVLLQRRSFIFRLFDPFSRKQLST
jgi:hypothetical protein